MISAWWLFWIVPICMSAGAFCMALAVAARGTKGDAMKLPKNCWDCPRSDRCSAPYYGGSGCTHEDVIRQKAIKELYE